LPQPASVIKSNAAAQRAGVGTARAPKVPVFLLHKSRITGQWWHLSGAPRKSWRAS